MTIAGRIAAPQGGVRERIAESIAEFVALRQELHHHPELAFQERRTSARIARRRPAPLRSVPITPVPARGVTS